ncbi:putative salt-induced outer membrane protein [Chitinivorax tropicus]|uniref:Putative salt-induced outer membrane protein n=1 Tax=Chitinivorax tropicus TaxID=714531 RepID=A0A840MG00_9PROT|nr:DUF481 domain-containing protein [Chitinivorax tropicus]MBB5018174.1 putative salt-induced outer membrane protein [Chitinivorax tropicus]
MKTGIALLAACLVSQSALADASPEAGWNGDVEIGMHLTSGNDSGQLWLGEIDLYHQTLGRSDRIQLDGRYQQKRDREDNHRSVSSARYKFSLKSEFADAPQDDYRFVLVRNRYNRFAYYQNMPSLVVGIGRYFKPTEASELALEIGPGVRWNRRSPGPTEREALLHVAEELEWKLTEQTSLVQEATIEAGRQVGVSHLELSIRNSLSKTLALKVGVTNTRENKIPNTQSEIETETRVTVVYSF